MADGWVSRAVGFGDPELEMLAQLQREEGARAGRPSAWTWLYHFEGETSMEAIKHAAAAGADLSGTVLLLRRFGGTRKQWLEDTSKRRPDSWSVENGHTKWWGTTYHATNP